MYLADVGIPDLSTTVFGKKIDFPVISFSNSNATDFIIMKVIRLQHELQKKWELVIACLQCQLQVLKKYLILTSGPKLFQLYVHKDRSITDNLIERCRVAGFDGLCLTVDTLVAGNRERDHRTGFSTPPRLTLQSLLSFMLHPQWSF